MKRELYIFDFDDTLVSSGALIKILDPDGIEVRALTSEEFANPQNPKQLTDEERTQGFYEDFSEFEVYPPDGEVLEPTYSAFLKAVSDHPQDVFIVTARGAEGPVKEFLADHGANDITVVAVSGSNPSLKGEVLKRLLYTQGPYTDIIVYEDSSANIHAMKLASTEFPETKFSYVKTGIHKESLLRKCIRSLLMELFNIPMHK